MPQPQKGPSWYETQLKVELVFVGESNRRVRRQQQFSAIPVLKAERRTQSRATQTQHLAKEAECLTRARGCLRDLPQC